VIAVLTSQAVKAQESLGTSYKCGTDLTMNDSRKGAEAVAVKNDKILALASFSEIISHRGNSDDK